MSINTLSFNQDASLITAALSTGFVIYKLTPNLQKHIMNSAILDTATSVWMMKNLNKSNLSLMITGDDKSRVTLWNDETKSSPISIGFKEPVRNVYITITKLLIVVLEKRVCVFNFQAQDAGVRDTFCNTSGVIAVSDTESQTIVAIPGLNQGEIAIWNITTNAYKTIVAHTNNIVATAISRDGSIVATASESGTNLHLYSIATGERTHTFKRGTFTALIYTIAISDDNKYVACCSANGTCHIFNVTEQEKNNKSALSFFSAIIPDAAGGAYFDSVWSAQTIDLGTPGVQIHCQFDPSNTLHIVAYNGEYFRVKGTDFTDIKKSKLLTNN